MRQVSRARMLALIALTFTPYALPDDYSAVSIDLRGISSFGQRAWKLSPQYTVPCSRLEYGRVEC